MVSPDPHRFDSQIDLARQRSLGDDGRSNPALRVDDDLDFGLFLVPRTLNPIGNHRIGCFERTREDRCLVGIAQVEDLHVARWLSCRPEPVVLEQVGGFTELHQRDFPPVGIEVLSDVPVPDCGLFITQSPIRREPDTPLQAPTTRLPPGHAVARAPSLE